MQDLSGCKGAETVEGRYQNIRKRKLFKLFNESVKDLTYYSNIIDHFDLSRFTFLLMIYKFLLFFLLFNRCCKRVITTMELLTE